MTDNEIKTDIEAILSNLGQVLKKEEFVIWFNTPMPALLYTTPLEAICQGRIHKVVALTEGYLNEDFS